MTQQPGGRISRNAPDALGGALDILGGALDERLSAVYGPDAAGVQRQRIRRAIGRFGELFGDAPGAGGDGLALDGAKQAESGGSLPGSGLRVFRSPGRTEIGGNHTDHQRGQVLAAAIDRDILAVACTRTGEAIPSGSGTAGGCGEPGDGSEPDRVRSRGRIRLFSEGFGLTEVRLPAENPGQPDPAEAGTVRALIRGVADEMGRRGFRIGGFDAYVTSDLPEGAGLSSSAAFEILIGTVLSELFNEGTVGGEELARIAQAAENRYYGKPCGLMDQTVCSLGGVRHMDFRNPEQPAADRIGVDFADLGYALCLTDTHGSHAEHTEDYAAVRRDLATAARVFGRDVLADVSPEDVIARSREIRRDGGDRAFLRAMHIAAENERVVKEVRALEQNNMPVFLELVRESGNSSYKYLQNVCSDRTPANQELAVALAISEALLGRSGACRVHGGGFAGTIQAFVPEEMTGEYIRAMDGAFGEGSCFEVRVCPEGSGCLI